LSSYGSFTLRWALDIGPGTRWFERTVTPLPGAKGVLLSFRNGLPWAQPSVRMHTHELGLGPAQRPALWLSLKEPAYRRPAELEIQLEDESIRARTSTRMRLRLYYSSLRPDWPPGRKPAVSHSISGGRAEPINQGVEWGDGSVEWDAEAGEYQLR